MNGIQGMGGPPPMGGMGGPPPAGGMRQSQSLTEDQQQTVEDLLEEYDPTELTEEDAKSIFTSLQEAGIRGAGVREAIKEAGFDADKLWSLAHNDQTSPAPASTSSQIGGQVNLSSLQSLQSILEQFDLTDMSDQEQQDLISQLNQAGLMRTGGMIDIRT